jgi:hypothetical protein
VHFKLVGATPSGTAWQEMEPTQETDNRDRARAFTRLFAGTGSSTQAAAARGFAEIPKRRGGVSYLLLAQ